MTITQDKTLYLAEKIVEFFEVKPPGVLIPPSFPDSLFIDAQFIPQLLPNLTKKDVAEGFLALHRQKVLEYDNWKDTYKGDYEKISFFDISVQQEKLKKFIDIAKSNLYGFKLSDGIYRKELIQILNTLVNSASEAVEIGNFEQKNKLDIFQKIADFSNSIVIEESQDADWDMGDEGEIYCAGVTSYPHLVIIKNKNKLHKILNEVNRIIKETYEFGINNLLKSKGELVWRCQKCGRWLATYDKPENIMAELDDFFDGGHKVCYKCRSKNIFSISVDGEINCWVVEN